MLYDRDNPTAVQETFLLLLKFHPIYHKVGYNKTRHHFFFSIILPSLKNIKSDLGTVTHKMNVNL